MKIIEPEIKYKFPSTGRTPFDLNNNEQYFAYADGFSNLANSLDYFSLNILDKNIPMGYKAILLCKRFVVLNDTGILKEWDFNEFDNVETDDVIGNFCVLTNIAYDVFMPNFNRYIRTHFLGRDEDGDKHIRSSVWNNKEDAITCAQKNLKSNDQVFLVCQVLDWINWH